MESARGDGTGTDAKEGSCILELEMLQAFKPAHLSRYKDLAFLLFKHGGRDLVEKFGLADLIPWESVDDELSGRAEELANDLERLGPTFVKLGQMLSSRADLLPVSYLRALSRLQDQVEPFPFEEIEPVLREDFGAGIEDLFRSFERTPVAAASLGQVHRAVLADGRAVVVKVQRPDIRTRVGRDLEAVMQLATLLDQHTQFANRYEFLRIASEFRRALMRELDYHREASHLRIVGRNLEDFDRIIVPKPIDELVSSRVLAMDRVDGVKVTELGDPERGSARRLDLAEHLFRAYLKQILEDGFFHADPHPGNVLLTADQRVGLLDLGMVGWISESMRDHLLNLLLAVSEGRGEDAANVAMRMGQRREGFDSGAFRREMGEVVAVYHEASVREMQIGQLIFEVSRVCGQTGLRIPPEIMMLGKTLMNLDQVGKALAPEFDPSAAIRRHAGEILRGRMLSSLRPGHLASSVFEMKRFLENLPRRLDGALDAVVNSRFRLTVDAIDEDRLIGGLQKIANRIAVGLVLASLIVGASLLMQVETEFTLLGYPGFAMICFIVAGGVGLVMVLRIVWSDLMGRRRRR